MGKTTLSAQVRTWFFVNSSVEKGLKVWKKSADKTVKDFSSNPKNSSQYIPRGYVIEFVGTSCPEMLLPRRLSRWSRWLQRWTTILKWSTRRWSWEDALTTINYKIINFRHTMVTVQSTVGNGHEDMIHDTQMDFYGTSLATWEDMRDQCGRWLGLNLGRLCSHSIK